MPTMTIHSATLEAPRTGSSGLNGRLVSGKAMQKATSTSNTMPMTSSVAGGTSR
jgi:hypothetical protein